MPRGRPLTPAQLAKAAEVYTATGNYSAAARAIGAPDPSTVRQALRRHADTSRHQLHARACARAIRKARRSLAAGIDVATKLLLTEAAAGSMEPRDAAALMNATARQTEALLAVAEREDRRRQAALTRRKTRAEIDAIGRRDHDGAGGDIELVVAVAGGAAVDPDAAAG